MAVLNELHYRDYLVGNAAVGAEHRVEIVTSLCVGSFPYSRRYTVSSKVDFSARSCIE